MKKSYEFFDILFLIIITGAITGFFINIGKKSFINLINIILVVLYILMLIRLITKKRLKFNYYSIVVLIVLICYLLVNAIISENTDNSFEEFFNVLLNIMYAYGLYNIYKSEELVYLMRKSFDFIMIGSFFSSILLPFYCTYYDILYQEIVWRGLFTHKNTLGNMAAFYILLLIIEKGRKKKLIFLLKILMALLILVLTKSHTPMYILLVCIIYLSIKKFINKDLAWEIFWIVNLFNYFIIFKFELVQKVLNAFNVDPTISGRSTIYEIVKSNIKQSIYFGHGLGATWNNNDLFINSIYNYVGFNPNSSHNAYLDFALSIGIIGVIIIIIMLTSIFFTNKYKFIYRDGEYDIVVFILFLLMMSLFESTLTNLNHVYGIVLIYTFLKLTENKKKLLYLRLRG